MLNTIKQTGDENKEIYQQVIYIYIYIYIKPVDKYR